MTSLGDEGASPVSQLLEVMIKEEDKELITLTPEEIEAREREEKRRKYEMLKEFKCEVCGKHFHRSADLRRHSICHTGIKPYVCRVCGKGFAQKPHLATHALLHEETKPFPCTLCEKGYTQRQKLEAHIKIVHEQARPYTCSLCNKRFARPDTYKLHIKRHDGYRPFACHLCQRTFTQAYNYRNHMALHSDTNPNICVLCNSSFSDRGSLNRHRRKVHKLKNIPSNSQLEAELLQRNLLGNNTPGGENPASSAVNPSTSVVNLSFTAENPSTSVVNPSFTAENPSPTAENLVLTAGKSTSLEENPSVSSRIPVYDDQSRKPTRKTPKKNSFDSRFSEGETAIEYGVTTDLQSTERTEPCVTRCTTEVAEVSNRLDGCEASNELSTRETRRADLREDGKSKLAEHIVRIRDVSRVDVCEDSIECGVVNVDVGEVSITKVNAKHGKIGSTLDGTVLRGASDGRSGDEVRAIKTEPGLVGSRSTANLPNSEQTASSAVSRNMSSCSNVKLATMTNHAKLPMNTNPDDTSTAVFNKTDTNAPIAAQNRTIQQLQHSVNVHMEIDDSGANIESSETINTCTNSTKRPRSSIKLSKHSKNPSKHSTVPSTDSANLSHSKNAATANHSHSKNAATANHSHSKNAATANHSHSKNAATANPSNSKNTATHSRNTSSYSSNPTQSLNPGTQSFHPSSRSTNLSVDSSISEQRPTSQQPLLSEEEDEDFDEEEEAMGEDCAPEYYANEEDNYGSSEPYSSTLSDYLTQILATCRR